MIERQENVARAIFSPRMIVNGELQPEAFKLREFLNEEYLSVMRMAITTWKEYIKAIPQRKNRKLYGYAELNVGEIRDIKLKNISFDVRECPRGGTLAHAGIFISVNGERLIGGVQLKSIETAVEQDFLVLAIQRELVDIAQKNLNTL